MRSIGIFVTTIILLASPVYAADDVVAKAMKLYEKRHYDEAAALLKASMASLDAAKQGAAQLTLGMIYLKNAELHRALYEESLAAHQDYLRKLAAAKGRGRSKFVNLYMGETLLEAGKPGPALNFLERFAGDESIKARQRAAAKAAIGLCYARKKNMQKAEEAWAGLDASDPEAGAALAEAYLKAGFKDKNPLELAERSMAGLKKSGSAPSLRMLKHMISVYAATGNADRGLELVRKADLKGYSYRETLSRTKIISFYDVSLLHDLAQLYLQAASAALERAAADTKLRETANFYLGESYAVAGNIDQSEKVTASFISSSGMPQLYRDKAVARQAANQYQKGRQFDAIGTWDELARKQPEDPELIAEILFACGRLRIDCPKIARKASATVEAGEGKRFANLNIALGRYYAGRRDYAKAVTYLESGRDKSNKNKIESNDPEMLVSLANSYYRTKKFSEALEIYFEMSKQFPEVRQIQEALQGIYAMEHKSAGDVKIN